MSNHHHSAIGGIAAIAVAFVLGATADAVPLTFSLDENASNLTIVGAFAGFETIAQDPPANTSITTTVGGTLMVDVDDVVSPSSIQFMGGDAALGISGDWLPGVGGETEGVPPTNAAPANYGLFLQVDALQTRAWAAFRDMVASPTSEATAVSGGKFASNQEILFTSGSFDFNLISALGDDANSDSFAGDAAANMAADGMYAIDGDLVTLTMPIEVGFGDDLKVSVTGNLVATAMVPEPTSGMLAFMGWVAMAGAMRRRKS